VWSSDLPVRSATTGAKSISTSSISMPRSSFRRSSALTGKLADVERGGATTRSCALFREALNQPFWSAFGALTPVCVYLRIQPWRRLQLSA
jgi:hypothetical protein